MRLLVFGSRGWGLIPDDLIPDSPEWQAAKELAAQEQDFMSSALAGFLLEATTLIHGNAPGADTCGAGCASEWNAENEPAYPLLHPIEILGFPADWRRYGKAAGFMRNQRMLDEGTPTLAVGFVNMPLADSKGSADMARRARRAGISTYVVERR